MSAIGEQYVDLVPREGGSSGGYLADGDVVPVERATVPQEVGALLDQADVLLASIGDTRLQALVDEAFEAPSWIGVEATHAPRYYNLALASRPFSQWRDDERQALDLMEGH